MLRRLHVKNFKLLRDVEIEFETDKPTVLIGPNASGKSTVIEVLDFLGRCAEDGLEKAIVAHGGMTAMRTAGAEGPLELMTEWSFGNTRQTWKLRWAFAVDATPNGQAFLTDESLVDGDRVLVGRADDGARVAFADTGPEAAAQRIRNLRALAFESVGDSERHEALTLLMIVAGSIRALGTLAAAPAWARAAPDRSSARDSVVISTQRFVGREGMALAAALYNMHKDHAEAWDHLMRAFRSEFPFVRRLVFPADPGGSRISFAIEDERFGGGRIFASEMSDGMVVYLCLLSLVLHPKQSGVLALDEPDAHLHPSAVRRLMALAHEQHGARALVIATHSNAVLDELRDPAASVRIVEPSSEGAKVRRLDPAALTAWRGEYSLSDLRRTGLLDPPNTAYGSDSGGGE